MMEFRQHRGVAIASPDDKLGIVFDFSDIFIEYHNTLAEVACRAVGSYIPRPISIVFKYVQPIRCRRVLVCGVCTHCLALSKWPSVAGLPSVLVVIIVRLKMVRTLEVKSIDDSVDIAGISFGPCSGIGGAADNFGLALGYEPLRITFRD